MQENRVNTSRLIDSMHLDTQKHFSSHAHQSSFLLATTLASAFALATFATIGCESRRIRAIEQGFENVNEHGERVREAAEP